MSIRYTRNPYERERDLVKETEILPLLSQSCMGGPTRLFNLFDYVRLLSLCRTVYRTQVIVQLT